MKQQVSRLSFLVVAFLFVGCAGITIIEDREPVQKTTEVWEYSASIFIPFIRYVPTPIDMDAFCKGNAWKEVYVTPDVPGGIIACLTLGIVLPERVSVTCSAK